MKKTNLNELRTKDAKNLVKLASEKRAEIKKERTNILSGKAKNLKVVKNLRRELAQILTVAKEKTIAEKIETEKKGETKK